MKDEQRLMLSRAMMGNRHAARPECQKCGKRHYPGRNCPQVITPRIEGKSVGAMDDIPGFGANAEGAKATHDLFLAYIDAGFTRAESLKIIIGIMGAMAVAQNSGKR